MILIVFLCCLICNYVSLEDFFNTFTSKMGGWMAKSQPELASCVMFGSNVVSDVVVWAEECKMEQMSLNFETSPKPDYLPSHQLYCMSHSFSLLLVFVVSLLPIPLCFIRSVCFLLPSFFVPLFLSVRVILKTQIY